MTLKSHGHAAPSLRDRLALPLKLAMHWVDGVILALLVSAAVVTVGHMPPVSLVDEWAFDATMAFATTSLPATKLRHPVKIIEIDDWTCDGWAKERGVGGCADTLVPRWDRIADLVHMAREGGARLVLVDLALRPLAPLSSAPGSGRLATDSQAAQDTLAFLKEAKRSGTGVPLILPRSVSLSNPGAGRTPQLRTLPLFPGLAEPSDDDLWMGLTLSALSADQAVRGVPLWNHVLSSADVAGRMASVPLLAVLLADGLPAQELACVFPASRLGPARNCSGKPEIAVSGQAISLTEPQQAWERIRFTIPLASHAPPGTLPTAGTVKVESLSAGGLDRADPQIFRDAIVLIGSTHHLSEDIHDTPLGPLPGLYILANQITALMNPAHRIGEGKGILASLAGKSWLIALLVLVQVMLFWLPNELLKAAPPSLGRSGRLLCRLGLVTLLGVSVAGSLLGALYYTAAASMKGLNDGQFVSILLPVIAVAIEAFFEVVKMFTGWAEARLEHALFGSGHGRSEKRGF